MAKVHPSALVHPGARLAADAEVGPFCVIGEHVEVAPACWIGAHVVLEGHTRIGRGSRIWHFASIGAEPQDKKYAGEPTRVEIGERNTIREYVTINRGTSQDAGATRVGDDNWIMAYVHFAHDCQVGSNAIFANGVQLAGHVAVGDWAVLGGVALIHQFVHVGAHAFVGMGACVAQDVPPYVAATGDRARPYGINAEGLKRRGFAPPSIQALKRAYRTLYRKGLGLEEALRELEVQAAACPEVRAILDFIARSKRGIIR